MNKFSVLKVVRNIVIALLLSLWICPFFMSFALATEYWYVMDLKRTTQPVSFSYPIICGNLMGVAMYWGTISVFVLVFLFLNKVWPVTRD